MVVSVEPLGVLVVAARLNVSFGVLTTHEGWDVVGLLVNLDSLDRSVLVPEVGLGNDLGGSLLLLEAEFGGLDDVSSFELVELHTVA